MVLGGQEMENGGVRKGLPRWAAIPGASGGNGATVPVGTDVGGSPGTANHVTWTETIHQLGELARMPALA